MALIVEFFHDFIFLRMAGIFSDRNSSMTDRVYKKISPAIYHQHRALPKTEIVAGTGYHQILSVFQNLAEFFFGFFACPCIRYFSARVSV